MHNLRDGRDAEEAAPVLKLVEGNAAESAQPDLVQKLQAELEAAQPAHPAVQAEAPDIVAKPAEPKKPPYRWILHPAIDLIFCCGGWVFLYAAAMVLNLVPDVTKHGTGLTVLAVFTLITFAITNVHQPVTLFRVYGSPITRRTLGKTVTILGFICVAVGFLTVSSSFMASLIARVTIGLTAQHFYAQTYGVSLIYCYKRNYYLSVWEKRLFFWMIQVAMWATIAYTFAREKLTVSGFELEKVATIPAWVCTAIDVVLALSVISVVAAIVRRLIIKRQMMPFPAILNVAVCFYLLLYLPVVGNGALITLAIVTQAFYHNLQYIVVATSYYLKESGFPEGMSSAQISKQLIRPIGLKYFVLLAAAACLVGMVISPGINQIGTHYGLKFEIVACAYYCATTLHHCLSDALIWRMKDPTTLKLLVA